MTTFGHFDVLRLFNDSQSHIELEKLHGVATRSYENENSIHIVIYQEYRLLLVQRGHSNKTADVMRPSQTLNRIMA